jgi:hypothetical protein
MTDPIVVVKPDQHVTPRLLRLLAGMLAMLAVLVGILAYSYFRVAGQLDDMRHERVGDKQVIADLAGRVADDSVVLSQVRDLAVLFGELLDPDATNRAETLRRLGELSEEIRREQAARAADRTTTAPPTTTPPPTSTTTIPPTPPTTCPVVSLLGVCL